MERPGGFLEYEKFTNLLDEIAPTTGVLMFYYMGEPFLNKRSYEMIRYARSKGIFVETCTNGDFVDAEGVMYSDVNQISFQIGGLDDKTHGVYRVRSNFSRIEKNLESLLAAKRKNPRSAVTVEVGFIVMKHNEHQVEDFIRWARELGVDRANVVDPCVRSVEEGQAMLTQDPKYWFYDEDAFRRGILRPKVQPNNECTWIWNSSMINWNGDVVPCCRDPHGRHVFGNAFEEGLSSVWNSPAIKEFRKTILDQQSQVEICRLCSGYGIPKLHQPRKVDFRVEHHSVNDPEMANLLDRAAGSVSVQIRKNP